jgi:hypothetical protein
MKKLITISWSYSDNYNIENTFLYKSFIKNNPIDNFIHIHYNRNEYADLEKDFKYKYGDLSEFILYKLYLTKSKIQSFETDYFVFADANDVVCLGDINTLPDTDKIIVSSEINRYPATNWWNLDYSEEEKNNLHFLNSGLFLTSKTNYIKLLENISNNVLSNHLKSFCGDQGVFIYHYLSKFEPEMILDKNSELFFNSYKRNHLEYIGYKFPMFLHDAGWNYGSPKFIEKFNLVNLK